MYLFLAIIIAIPTAQAQSVDKVVFQTQVGNLWAKKSSLTKDKKLTDIVEVTLEGDKYEPPIVIGEVERDNISRKTVLDAFSSDISAIKLADKEWLIENWAEGERQWPQKLVNNDNMLAKSSKWAQDLGYFKVNAVLNYEQYKLVFLANQPLIYVFKKIDNEWFKTNDLVSNEEFDVVFTSYRYSSKTQASKAKEE